MIEKTHRICPPEEPFEELSRGEAGDREKENQETGIPVCEFIPCREPEIKNVQPTEEQYPVEELNSIPWRS